MAGSSLSRLRDLGHGLWASCTAGHACSHFADLDLEELIARFGPDFDYVARRAELVAALRCGGCGSDQVEVRVRAPSKHRT